MKRLAPALLALSIFLTGCSNSTGLAPSVSQSGFDGGRVVDIEPHGNSCASMICSGLGAQWSSTNPDIVFLKIKYLMNTKELPEQNLISMVKFMILNQQIKQIVLMLMVG